MEIREAEPSDAPAVREVADEAWHAAHADILGPGTVEEVLEEWYDVDGLREAIGREDGHFLVADDGEVTGFAQAHPTEDGPADAVLPRIYVRPDRWGEGVGSALLARVFERLAAEGCEDLWLAVLADNDVARPFYEARGFEIHEERTVELFGVETEDLVLVRDLPDG